jgi:hypothetical protein
MFYFFLRRGINNDVCSGASSGGSLRIRSRYSSCRRSICWPSAAIVLRSRAVRVIASATGLGDTFADVQTQGANSITAVPGVVEISPSRGVALVRESAASSGNPMSQTGAARTESLRTRSRTILLALVGRSRPCLPPVSISASPNPAQKPYQRATVGYLPGPPRPPKVPGNAGGGSRQYRLAGLALP